MTPSSDALQQRLEARANASLRQEHIDNALLRVCVTYNLPSGREENEGFVDVKGTFNRPPGQFGVVPRLHRARSYTFEHTGQQLSIAFPEMVLKQ